MDDLKKKMFIHKCGYKPKRSYSDSQSSSSSSSVSFDPKRRKVVKAADADANANIYTFPVAPDDGTLYPLIVEREKGGHIEMQRMFITATITYEAFRGQLYNMFGDDEGVVYQIVYIDNSGNHITVKNTADIQTMMLYMRALKLVEVTMKLTI